MIEFDVRPDGADEFRLVATSRDVSLWERTGKGRSVGQIERDPRMSQLEEVAYTACRRQGLWSGTLEEFRANVDIQPIDQSTKDDEDEQEGTDGLDPTQTDR